MKPNNVEADRAVEFISSLPHAGDYLGQPFDLRPWQEDIIRTLFGTLKKNGKRQYKKILLVISRKNGKSELIAAMALYCLCAMPGNGKQSLIRQYYRLRDALGLRDDPMGPNPKL